MKLTRNTKLCKSTGGENIEVIFRSLTITEMHVIDKINSSFHKAEIAFELGYISGGKPNFLVQQEIGRDVIMISTVEMNNETLFSLTVDEYRSSIDNDMMLTLIQHVLNILPGTSIEYLFSLTHLDIIELAAMCEKISNKKIFNNGQSQSQSHEIKQEEGFFAEDDGKSLQDKMKEMEKF